MAFTACPPSPSDSTNGNGGNGGTSEECECDNVNCECGDNCECNGNCDCGDEELCDKCGEPDCDGDCDGEEICDKCGEPDCDGDCDSEEICEDCEDPDCDGDCDLNLVYTGPLDTARWIEILALIGEKNKPAHLNLSGCTVPPSTPGGHIFFYHDDGASGIFYPLANGGVGEAGKALIKTLILPSITRVIPGGDTGNFSFKNFTSLESITGGVTIMGPFAFYGLAALEEFNFTEASAVIHPSAFKNCTGLKSINTPNIVYIAAEAFAGCTSLVSVDLPNVHTMEPNVFNGCTSLKTVNLPKAGVLDPAIFIGCVSLEQVDMPLVGIIHNSTFKNFANLKTVNFLNVTYIAAEAFAGCTSLVEVNFPNAITIIEENVFNGCTNLKTVNLPKLETLVATTFIGCVSLENVSIPLISVIYPYTFKDLTNLKTVNFSSVKEIAAEAFAGCTSLTTVSFPSATIIRENAFRDCVNLTTAVFHANPAPTPSTAALDGHPLAQWIVHKTGIPFSEETVSFGEGAFRGCEKLNVLDIRNAWNVYFLTGALAEIGEHLNIYLYDDSGKSTGGKSFGHPQLEPFLGGSWGSSYSTEGVTLKTITLYLPAGYSMVENTSNYDGGGDAAGYRGIKASIESIYRDIFGNTHGNYNNVPIVDIISPIP
ncbi:MAG: leucine-rich repeat protein [Treponema sp.]|nr:leucine-rich repeat protein [Treponema sp.]